MKTTIELPEELYRRTKAFAALTGRTVKDVIAEALQAKLGTPSDPDTPRGWRSVFGAVPSRDVKAIQAVIDEELSVVDPDDWR